ncbi:HyfF [Desulforapulum autotrophicum HRM2]|uniref:HyfF n=1 Tax=Desulforapulum autotrophicum (strain ATCC 43914 / DSM 3382 / VKM B-1955 / HRM2) TaxID=177437 RepID=C0QBF6_DESAH|nr:proton-conducting transporter membrane subunit [Desulforapulum autotrophicum]ACN16958.1 HyfF [Desulforapulum autotrophicum HRM2]
MMIWLILLVPAAAGLICFLSRSRSLCRYLLCVAAVFHSLLVGWQWFNHGSALQSAWIGLDDAGLLFLSITSLLFLGSSVYTFGYLKAEAQGHRRDMEENILFKNSNDAVFTGCLLFFLSTMSLVTVSRHLGLMWVAIEATTLSSAPLIYYHRHHRSLEAVWKYLLICSIGIALAMLGNFFIVVAGSNINATGSLLSLDTLMANATRLNPTWLKAAFVLCLVGYGTKMGLAPMHNWLPDAHSEAPSSVSALLSGALLNCAFLVLLRIHVVMTAAGLGQTSGRLFMILGLISLVIAAIFIIGQKDFKRMLAYSSVEHMGIIALGIGVGGIGISGSIFHAVNHSLIKGMLFMTAGNLMTSYQTKDIAGVSGLIYTRPVTAILWLAGTVAIIGSPPFGIFLSELTILGAMVDKARYGVAAVYLLTLGIIFAALSAKVLPMVFSQPPGQTDPKNTSPTDPEPAWSIAPLAVFGILSLILGIYMPPWLAKVLDGITLYVGGQ